MKREARHRSVVLEFARTHYVTRVPLAIVATGCTILSFPGVGTGIVLSTVGGQVKAATQVLLLVRD